MNYEQSICPTGHQIIGRRLGNLKLVLPTRHFPDFVWTVLGDCVATDRVLTLFVQNGLTGFRKRPATIEEVKRLRRGDSFSVPKVWELEAVGKGGDAHPDSGIKLLHICTGCGARYHSSFKSGIIVDETQWDGSDFFTISGYPAFILITERVKNLITDHGLTNCGIFKSQDLKWGDTPRPEDHPEESLPRKAVN